DLTYAIGSNGHGFEVALPTALIGNASAIKAYADVNNSAFLPAIYSSGGYMVGTLPPVTIGSITLDGSLADWTAAQRLDDGTVAGFALYGDVQAGDFLFAINDANGTIGAGTTIWLDTDLNAATGYQVFGSTVGAEYNIEIGADGTARLYSG